MQTQTQGNIPNSSAAANADAIVDAKTGEAVVADVVARHIKPKLLKLKTPDVVGVESIPLLVLPHALRVESVEKLIEPYRTEPKRRTGTAKLVDLESFIRHVKRFKNADSALFALPGEEDDEPTLTAVFDYHDRVVAEDGSIADDPRPRFGVHRARYEFPLADEWTAWMEHHGKPLDQAKFAEFLEDRILDVAPPDGAFANTKAFGDNLGLQSFASPAKLLELSRGLSVHVNDRTANKVNPSTGETTLMFETEHTDDKGAPLTVPRAFIIQIPVFREGAAYQLPVRLKYRAGGGRITWIYEIHEPRRAFDNAFREACTHAEEATSLPLFYGSPEA